MERMGKVNSRGEAESFDENLPSLSIWWTSEAVTQQLGTIFADVSAWTELLESLSFTYTANGKRQIEVENFSK